MNVPKSPLLPIYHVLIDAFMIMTLDLLVTCYSPLFVVCYPGYLTTSLLGVWLNFNHWSHHSFLSSTSIDRIQTLSKIITHMQNALTTSFPGMWNFNCTQGTCIKNWKDRTLLNKACLNIDILYADVWESLTLMHVSYSYFLEIDYNLSIELFSC